MSDYSLVENIENQLQTLKQSQIEQEHLFRLAKNTTKINYGNSNPTAKGLNFTQQRFSLNRLINKEQTKKSQNISKNTTDRPQTAQTRDLTKIKNDPSLSKQADLLSKDFSTNARTNQQNNNFGNLESMISNLDPNKFKTNQIYKKENKVSTMTKKKTSQAKTRNDRKLLEMDFLNDEMRELLEAKINKINDVKQIEDIPVKPDLEDDKSADGTDNDTGHVKKEKGIDFGPKLDALTLLLKRLPTRNYQFCQKYKQKLMDKFGQKIDLEQQKQTEDFTKYKNTQLMDNRDVRTTQVVSYNSYFNLMEELIGDHQRLQDYKPILSHIQTTIYKYGNEIFDIHCLHQSIKQLNLYINLKSTFDWYIYDLNSDSVIDRRKFCNKMEEQPQTHKLFKQNENCTIEEHFKRIDFYNQKQIWFRQVVEQFIDRYVFLKITNKINRLQEGDLEQHLKVNSKQSVKEIELKYFKGKHINLIKGDLKLKI